MNLGDLSSPIQVIVAVDTSIAIQIQTELKLKNHVQLDGY